MKGKFISNILFLIVIVAFMPFGCSKRAEEITPETTNQVKSAIKSHIDATLAANDGLFVFEDENKGKMALKFDYIHESVHKKGGDYFACVDFIDDENNSYDVDIYVTGPAGKMNVQKVVFHKEKGKKGVGDNRWPPRG